MTEDNTARAETILNALRVTLVGVLEAAPAIPARVRLSLNGSELDVSWHDLSICIALSAAGAAARRRFDGSATRCRLDRELQRRLHPEEAPEFDDPEKDRQERRE
jgi:hypothetical protein